MSVSSASSTIASALQGISGYDFSGIVDSLVSVYKLPETAMVNKQTALQTTSDAWKDVNTRVKALYDTMTGLSDSPTWTSTQASSSNTNVINATTGINATQGVYNIHVTSIAKSQTVSSAAQNVVSPTSASTLSAGTFKLTVGTNTPTITVTANESLSDIASSINDAKAGVSASVIKVTGGYKLAISATKTGIENAASYSDLTGNVLASLGILTGIPATTLNESQAATDATLTINGITDITSSSNSISSAILGVTLNVSGADTSADALTTVNVSANNSTAQTKIQAFIDQYNSTMDFIDTKMSYDTTTKKAGDLFGDQTLQGIQSHLRGLVSGLMNNPTAPYSTLASIGITTSSDNFGKDAKLSFDTTKFATAMATNSDSVANLFGATSGGVTPLNTGINQQGLANLMGAYLKPMVMYGGSFAQKQAGYDTQITDYKTRITALEASATAYQAAQKAKFATLETLLSSLNSQSTSLTGMINSLDSQTSKK